MKNVQVSRPVVFALIGAVVLLAAYMLTKPGGDEVVIDVPIGRPAVTPKTGPTPRTTRKRSTGQSPATGSAGATEAAAPAPTPVAGASPAVSSGATTTAGEAAEGARIKRAEANKLRDEIATRRRELAARIDELEGAPLVRQKVAARKAGLPLRVYRARRAGKIVIVFFWEPKGREDKLVNRALDKIDRERKNLVVFKDKISRWSRYDGIALATRANQTPSIIIMYYGRAYLHEGYIDEGTLRQKIVETVHRRDIGQ